MDFENILTIASQNQGLSSSQVKRYSLQTGPAKKVPKIKGVESAAVQAFLKKKEIEQKRKEMETKKRKEELLAKRVELKSDRKARAMASRTKDNFRGYNGIPVVEQPKKRHSRRQTAQQASQDFEDEDRYEYSQTDSDPEPEPQKLSLETLSKDLSKPSKKAMVKSGPPTMNFEALLKLAEKKQHEPVELKPKKKNEERLRTAEELKELELERRAKKQDRGRESRPERDLKAQGSPSSSKRSSMDKDVRYGTPHKGSWEKLPHSGLDKKPKPNTHSERTHSTAKPTQGNKHVSNGSKTTGALSSKPAAKASSHTPLRPPAPRPSPGHKPISTSDLTQKRGNPPIPPGKSSSLGAHPGATPSLAPARMPATCQVRPGSSRQVGPNSGSSGEQSKSRPGLNKPVNSSQGSSGKTGSTASMWPGKVEPVKWASGPPARAGNNGQMRPATGGPARQQSHVQSQPGGSSQTRMGNGSVRPAASGPGRPGSGMSQPMNGMASGPGRPKCTVVAETISSKDVAPRPGVPQRLPPGYRPVMRPPGTMLPPITSSYKRKYEDEEDYDPEMDDFIDDGGDDQDEISKHIREIFGYDKNKYKDESDYALKFMESSWKEQQKEEARSLRLGIKEDEEDMRLEEEERKRKLREQAVTAKRKRM